jgi:hypothetical protein
MSGLRKSFSFLFKLFLIGFCGMCLDLCELFGLVNWIVINFAFGQST